MLGRSMMCREFHGKYLMIYWENIDLGKDCELTGKTLSDHWEEIDFTQCFTKTQKVTLHPNLYAIANAAAIAASHYDSLSSGRARHGGTGAVGWGQGKRAQTKRQWFRSPLRPQPSEGVSTSQLFLKNIIRGCSLNADPACNCQTNPSSPSTHLGLIS